MLKRVGISCASWSMKRHKGAAGSEGGVGSIESLGGLWEV